MKQVSRLKLDRLKEIATVENIVLPAKDKLLKDDYIQAIVSARHPQTVAEVEVEEENEVEDHVEDPDAQAAETFAKKMIAGKHNVTQLEAIIAKEKIEIKSGRKVKQDYVDAIYNARNKV